MVRISLLTCCVIVAACASKGASAGQPVAAIAVADSVHLTAEEFGASGLPTAYDVIERYRRPWLRRDARTGAEVTVYMEEQSLGGAPTLRDIPAVDVESFEFMPSDKAMLRWGSRVKGSVIVVMRKR